MHPGEYLLDESASSIEADAGCRTARHIIPSGAAVRFEPGEEKEIELTDFAGCARAFARPALLFILRFLRAKYAQRGDDERREQKQFG